MWNPGSCHSRRSEIVTPPKVGLARADEALAFTWAVLAEPSAGGHPCERAGNAQVMRSVARTRSLINLSGGTRSASCSDVTLAAPRRLMQTLTCQTKANGHYEKVSKWISQRAKLVARPIPNVFPTPFICLIGLLLPVYESFIKTPDSQLIKMWQRHEFKASCFLKGYSSLLVCPMETHGSWQCARCW